MFAPLRPIPPIPLLNAEPFKLMVETVNCDITFFGGGGKGRFHNGILVSDSHCCKCDLVMLSPFCFACLNRNKLSEV